MTQTLSIRIDAETKERLDQLAQQCQRSRSFLAAEAITEYVRSQEWQLAEIAEGIAELERGETVDHAELAGWLRSWGSEGEQAVPAKRSQSGEHPGPAVRPGAKTGVKKRAK